MLAATAQEQHTRWVATINLLEIAASITDSLCSSSIAVSCWEPLSRRRWLAYYFSTTLGRAIDVVRPH